ncbi:MAG: cyclodeaminase/cyclohydrolase family protein [Candidatus Limnocylindria bacterium]
MSDRLNDLSVRRLVERLATSDPVPGGGSAAALAGAMGAALAHMVVELTIGRPAAGEHAGQLGEIGMTASSLQAELLNLAELDAAAYDAVIRARRLPRASDREREARAVQVAAATRDATRIPLETARAAAAVLDLTEALATIGNSHAISDVGVAAMLATTALRGAALNVRINLPHLPDDEPMRNDAEAELERLLAGLDERDLRVRAAVAERMA